ncbi:MAG: hypothetical protein JKX84_02200 [Flavobacteriales bacterium]|nr:hypothetical protein [Flavobacteriales bacterium]
MKVRIALILLAASTIVSCDMPPNQSVIISEEKGEMLPSDTVRQEFELIVIDSCQYVLLKEQQGTNRGYGYMAHKGNCNNPIHLHACPLHCLIPSSNPINQVTEP